ncbi:glutathione binding-like protein [Mesorhizobium kowhaii]|uniref:glutathione binding-like protein n=1 Tax=Mesorhizobium kowhaii TaxID=1300272 RepID=UPI0035E96FC1
MSFTLMLAFLSTEIHKGFIPLFYAAGDYLEIARPKLEKRYAWINEHLANKPFLMGDTFTVADTYLFALTGWGQAPWLKSYENAQIRFDSLQHLQRRRRSPQCLDAEVHHGGASRV